MNFRMAVRLAVRDLRGGLGGLWVLVAGIALGVALMAAVGSVAGSLLDTMRSGARESVGGDLSLRLFHAPPTNEQRAFLTSLGTLSVTAELRSRVDGRLVEVKAVDGAYPLAGEARVAPGTLSDALEHRNGLWGAVAEEGAVGQRFALGAVEVEVRAVLIHEPDRAFRAFSLGPRLIVAAPALEASGLAGPGAAVYWYSRLRLPEGTDPAAVLAEIERRFPDAGWRMVNAAEGVPGMERMLAIARTLFVLVSLGILLIGGVGVGASVRAAMEARSRAIATLKALGASRRLVFAAFLIQVMAVAALAVVLGLAVGAMVAWHPPALAAAGSAGLLAALMFALPPLAVACAARPAETWRALAPPRPGWRVVLAVLVVAGLLAALLVAWTGMPVVVVAFAGISVAITGALRGVGHGLAVLARRMARRTGGPRRRIAWANLGHSGAPTGPVVMAFGLGLTLVVAIAVVGAAALRHVDQALLQTAPALFVLNLDAGQVAAVEALGAVETAPFLHGRISRLNGVPTTDATVPGSVAWAVRGDRGLSWRATAPPGEIVAGQWWAPEYQGPPLAALDARVAGRLGLMVGDTLTLAMPHGSVTATVAVLRRMDWVGLDLDFPVLLSPPAEAPPHTIVAAVRAAPDALPDLIERLGAVAPDAPVVRVDAVLAALAGFVAEVRRALLSVAGLAVAAATVVLAGAVAASLRRRRREAAVLFALGVGRRQLAVMSALEFAVLGLSVAGVAVPLGLGLAVGVVAVVLPDAPVSIAPLLPVLVLVGAVAGLAGVGAGLAYRPPSVRGLARDDA